MFKRRKLTTEEFIAKAKAVHDDTRVVPFRRNETN